MKDSVVSKCVGWAVLIAKFGSVQVLVQTIGFCAGLLLVRFMSKEDYALYTLAITMLGTMAVLSDSGVGSGATSLAGRFWGDAIKLGQVVKTAIRLRWIFGIAVAGFFSPVLFFWLKYLGTESREAFVGALLVALTLFFQTGSSILSVVPRMLLQANRLQSIEFFTSLVRLAAVGAAWLFFLDFVTALLAGLASAVFQWFLFFHMTRHDFRRDVQVDPGIKSAILKIVVKHSPNAIYYCIQSHLVIWLLGIFGSSATLADAGALGRLAVVFTIVGNIVASLVMPRFSRCDSAKLLWWRYHQVVFLLILALFGTVMLAVLFPTQMLWILGGQYKGLELEFLLMVIAQSVNCLLMALSTLNLGRGWIVSPWVAIPIGITSYVSLFYWIGVSTLSQVLLAGIIVSVIAVFINYVQAIYSISRLDGLKK